MMSACGRGPPGVAPVPSALPLLVGSDELGPGELVAVHGFFEGGLGRLFQVGQDRVERVELEEVAVPADRKSVV